MSGILDDICPPAIGARAIVLAPADLTPPRAFAPVDLLVTIHVANTQALQTGLSVPLELVVTAPSPSGFVRRFYRRVVPSRVTFTPQEGGDHTVRLRELGHNEWWGAYTVSVAGERSR